MLELTLQKYSTGQVHGSANTSFLRDGRTRLYWWKYHDNVVIRNRELIFFAGLEDVSKYTSMRRGLYVICGHATTT